MVRWQQLWLKIIEPSEHLASRAEREQASLHAAVIFVEMIFVSLIILLTPVIQVVAMPVLIISLISTAGLYALNRTIYYRWSVRLALWGGVSLIFYSAIYLVADNNLFVLAFLVSPLVISSLILSHREAIINIISMLILVMIHTVINGNSIADSINVNLLITLVGSMTIIASGAIDRYRQQAMDNEARFRSLMNANYEGILIVDGEDASILDANPASEQILGYSASELIGRYPVEFVAPGDRQLARNIWLKRTENIPIEANIVHKDGYELSVEAHLRPYRFHNNKSYVLTILDISERKQAEKFIVESEERFRAIFNESVHYIGVLDAEGKILEFNGRALKKFGLQAYEVPGKYLHDFDYWAHSEKSKVRTKAVIEAAIKGQSSRYEIQARDKDGAMIYLDFSVKPIVDGTGSTRMIIAESRDMTDYRLAEARRREFEQRYETLFNNTTDAVFIFDMAGLITDANQRAETMLQASRDEIVGHYVFEFVVDDEVQHTSTILAGLRENKRVSVVNERQMRRATGEVFFAETMGLVVTDNQNRPRYVQSMVRDVSERKRIEAERFATALDSERTQLLAHFIENASHHFRTPITSMKTRMYLLARVFENPAKRDEQIDILNQELERLQNILDDLLMVLRLQKDDSEYSPAKVPVNQLLSEVRQKFEGQDVYNNFNWIWQLDEQNSVILGDKGLLSRALINLVENAIAYTPSKRDISVRSFSQDDYIVLEVIDDGSGIPEDELPYIFDDFYRGQDAMQDNSTSSGLGLSITRMIVERYQGTIFVASPATGGAHFQIVLPCDTEDESHSPEMPSHMLHLTMSS